MSIRCPWRSGAFGFRRNGTRAPSIRSEKASALASTSSTMAWSEHHFFRSGKSGPKSRQERALAQDARPDRFRHQDLVFPLVKISSPASCPAKSSEILPTLLGCYQEILLNNTRWRRPFGLKGQLEIVKKHPVKNSVFWMTLSVHPCHGREDDSRNRPRNSKKPQRPDTPEVLH